MTYELRLSLSGRAIKEHAVEAIVDRLIGLGVDPGAIAEQEERGRRRVCIYAATARDAQRWFRRLTVERMPGARLTVRRLRDADWQEPWKRFLRPFAITPTLRLVPAWNAEAKRGPSPRRIVIETGMAFGTGKHPTTRWIARCIAGLRGRFQDVLDIGLGTGILAVVAHRSGAKRIVGVDIDPQAVVVSRRNLALNGVPRARLIQADFSTLRLPRAFDLIVANIGTKELLGMRGRMLRALRPGGFLAVAGIPKSEADQFRRAFGGRELRCVRAHLASGWAGFLYQRRSPGRRSGS